MECYSSLTLGLLVVIVRCFCRTAQLTAIYYIFEDEETVFLVMECVYFSDLTAFFSTISKE